MSNHKFSQWEKTRGLGRCSYIMNIGGFYAAWMFIITLFVELAPNGEFVFVHEFLLRLANCVLWGYVFAIIMWYLNEKGYTAFLQQGGGTTPQTAR